jgi:hypothetical protein
MFYAFRKQVAEPVIGTINRRMDFREVTVRGLKMASQEWSLLMCGYNLKRMHKLALSRK